MQEKIYIIIMFAFRIRISVAREPGNHLYGIWDCEKAKIVRYNQTWEICTKI
jgi:uncharacterized cupin superfamily protein